MFRKLFPISLLALLAVACASSGEGRVCAPKQRVKCLCRGGAKGDQLCADDGKSFVGECGNCVNETGTEPGITGPAPTPAPTPTPTPADGGTGPKARCKNQIVEPGEACDGTPGCTDTCTPSGGYQGCDESEVHVWPASVTPSGIEFSGSGAGYYDLTSGSCGGQGGLEGVFTIYAHEAGLLSVRLVPSGFDGVLHLRKGCSDQEVACVNKEEMANEPETAKVSVQKSEKVYVYVDGLEKLDDTFTLNLRID